MKRLFFCCLILLIALSACNGGPQIGAPAATDLPAQTATAANPTPTILAPAATDPAATLPPAEQPTAVAPIAEPTAAPAAPGVLPAPLLLLAVQEETMQIWRIETDGVTRSAITAEASPVLDFDVSPADGRLVYLVNNDLIIANADGSGRMVMVDGPEMPAENDPQGPLSTVGKPRWSPDGTRIAYSLGGVNIIPATGGPGQLLLKSDPLPVLPAQEQGAQPGAQPTITPAYSFWPESWSPDGSRLLIGYALFPESAGFALLDPAGGQPQFIQNLEPFACCFPAWTVDSASIYWANPYFGMSMAGLWRANPADGSAATLIQGDPQNGTYTMPGFVQPVGDSLNFFLARSDAFPEGPVELSPVRAPISDPASAAPLRSDAYLIGEALWTPDGSAVVILSLEAVAPDAKPDAPTLGQLLYLKSDNSPAITLPGSGYQLRWGK